MSEFFETLSIVQGWVLLIAFFAGYAVKGWRKLKAPNEKQDERLEVLEKGVRSLLRNEIFTGVRMCEVQGYRSEEDTVSIKKMHEAYQALGGNGIEEEYFKDFMKLKLGRDS